MEPCSSYLVLLDMELMLVIPKFSGYRASTLTALSLVTGVSAAAFSSSSLAVVGQWSRESRKLEYLSRAYLARHERSCW